MADLGDGASVDAERAIRHISRLRSALNTSTRVVVSVSCDRRAIPEQRGPTTGPGSQTSTAGRVRACGLDGVRADGRDVDAELRRVVEEQRAGLVVVFDDQDAAGRFVSGHRMSFRAARARTHSGPFESALSRSR